MREIINPWNDVEGYNCYGCCAANPIGARMRFFEEEPDNVHGDIVSVWQPAQNYQSWINTLHGGMQATLLDEICGWVVFKKLRTSGVTAKMELRYKHPVSTVDGPLVLRARLKSDNHRVAVVEGELRDKNDAVLTSCECTYFSFAEDKARGMGFREAALDDKDLTLDEVKALILSTNTIKYRPL